MISLDVAATAAALAGVPDTQELDGVNLLPYLRGETSGAPHETLYWRWIAQSAVRDGPWKYLRGGAREYLFNLDEDREEARSVIQEHPEIAERLRAKLARWASEMDPPGVETRTMAETWEQYFDHYLDGKRIPKPSPAEAARGASGRDLQGWIARNGTAEASDGALRVRPDGKGQRPFIVVSRLDLPKTVTAVVRLRADQDGRGAFAWREVGQKDFPSEQVAPFECPRSDESNEYRVPIPAKDKVIHVRLLLPPGGADIESVQFESPTGKPLREWRFGR